MKILKILICLSQLLMGCTLYQTRDLDPGYFNNEFNQESVPSEISSEALLSTSSLISVKALHSGMLSIMLSGALNLDHSAASHLSDRSLQVPVFAYLIHHEEYGYYLIDTGTDSSYIDNPYGSMEGGALPTTMVETSVNPENTIDQCLLNEGLTPQDIPSIFFTHLHLDHISGVSVFPHSVYYVAGEGEECLTYPGFVEPDHLQDSDTIHIIHFSYSYCSDSPLGRVWDIFGDGSLWAISTPGHSAGHVSYLVNTLERPVLIAGDACILNEGWNLRVGPGSYSEDMKKAQKTLDVICDFTDDNPQVVLWAGHDYPPAD